MASPFLLDGPMNGLTFLADLGQVPGLALAPGDRVTCDNLSAHEVDGVAAGLALRVAELHHLPACSPDLHPIEMAFAKLNVHLREVARRTFGHLLRATAATLESFTPARCRNFLRHAL